MTILLDLPFNPNPAASTGDRGIRRKQKAQGLRQRKTKISYCLALSLKPQALRRGIHPPQ
jgi:hypothetical protein